MKTEVIKAHWKLYTVFSVLTLLVGSALIYYFLFFVPQLNAKDFVTKNEGNFLRTKDNVSYLEETVSNWNDFVSGEMEQKTAKLTETKKSFEDLKSTLTGFQNKQETKELSSILNQYCDKSINLLNNILTISEYFKKVEKSVSAFNSLNTQTNSIDELKKLVLDFKSVSESSLAELEKIEAPQAILGIDKDYKDLLRQYIESANLLTAAIEQNNISEVEKVGKSSDEAVSLIANQLSTDLTSFIETSNMAKDMELIKSFKKLGEEKIAKLKNKYKI
ncbi:hypothetical protein HGB13_00890 [bacterium]|nr:hypothetical protein [bacterium]